ncbi:transglutaminase-like domain-containing protein [Saccharibacillus kuerlensis]|uniref:Transglutaminase-like domain-containing protein n=1 Tax=Saccharibacillus kuerlensis TaxID=459527 RepID=A0ABQ2L2N1_9BACL|nr:transglutaminase-like domain-containing protein [Saccharibacillus kuerlensis]GGO00437.1 hypothetical protein GCM10010969_21650 [Saccharibacillus kuerlensis]
MYKWILKVALVMSLIVCIIPSFAASAAGASWLDTSTLQQGTVGVQYSGSTAKRHKVMIAKASTVYTYDLNASRKSETFPLQSGNGSYEVTLLENVSGTSYKKIGSTSVDFRAQSSTKVFLGSVQNVNWKDSKKAVAMAKKLTAGKKTDRAKAEAIYKYVVTNVRYDQAKANALSGGAYLPSADSTLVSKKGICYDYSSLMGVMLRSSGIPTKLVMGKTTYVKEYHAWNEIYLNGKWITVDATVDAAYKKAGKKISLAKDSKKYSAQKVY